MPSILLTGPAVEPWSVEEAKSFLRAENDVQVAAFLARTPDAVLQPLDARFGRDSGAGSQRLPGDDGMDGFFYARLHKA